MNKILVVVAHPDDEVLGCGGTVIRHVTNGDQVRIVYMADGVGSREESTDKQKNIRETQARRACRLLGIEEPYFFGFPDNAMDTVPFLEIVQKLERKINEICPVTIYTHHGGDLNIDHQLTHRAVLTACRPQPGFCVQNIFSFEVHSSTEWATPSIGSTFVPQYFVNIKETLGTKMKALKIYDSEMRGFPHSRSYDSVQAKAVCRGSAVGMEQAEAFMIERMLVI